MSDLISRQDVLDVLRNLAFDYMFQCGEYYGEDERQLTIINARKAIDVIEAMPSAEPKRTAKVIEHDASITDDRGYKYLRSEYLCGRCKKKEIGGDEYCSHCGVELDWGKDE